MQTLKCTHNICLNFGETNHHKFSSLTKHQFSTFQFCRKSKQAPMFSYLSQCVQQVAVSPGRWVLGEKPCSYLFQPPDAAGLPQLHSRRASRASSRSILGQALPPSPAPTFKGTRMHCAHLLSQVPQPKASRPHLQTPPRPESTLPLTTDSVGGVTVYSGDHHSAYYKV